MELKPHLLYSKDSEAKAEFIYKHRYPGNQKTDDEVELVVDDNREKRKSFEISMRSFVGDYKRRVSERVQDLGVPQEVIAIELKFHGLFKSNEFEKSYWTDFGLVPISFTDFNTRGLFLVENTEVFKGTFWDNLKRFVNNDSDYNRNLIYIKDFKLHTSKSRLKQYDIKEPVVYLELVDSTITKPNLVKPTIKALNDYLDSNGVVYSFNEFNQSYELKKPSEELVNNIARNFDAVHAINSYRHIVTFPNRYGVNVKGYPFTIVGNGKLPIIGVVDTGVSSMTPLASIIVNEDNSYGINGLNPLVDEADNGYGHGTCVAALAALGSQLSNELSAELIADAKILSLKILSGAYGVVTNSEVINLIKKVCEDPSLDVKIFTLTINYENSLGCNENVSEYAYQLDKLAFEYDVLIFISTANQGAELDLDNLNEEYPNHFKKSCSNLNSPAESMNNFTIGSIGDNLDKEVHTEGEYPLSSASEPAAYTRKYHLIQKKSNSKLIKPDAVFAGGNFSLSKWDFDDSWVVEPAGANAMKVLSAHEKDIIIEQTGTSLSTPLVANIAAKILRQYPDLRAQSIKALLINSTNKLNKTDRFKDFKDSEYRALVGHGIPNEERCLYSNENSATLILEERIRIGECRSFKLFLPQYLNDAEKNDGLLRFEVTLCYSFKPIKNKHLAYCPININCGIFKNVPLEIYDYELDRAGRNRKVYKGITGAGKDYYAFSEGWSQYQDGMDKSKMLSNVQKSRFYAKKSDIVNEENCFKITIGSHFHKLLPDFVTEILPQENEVSIVIRITDCQKNLI